MINIKRTVSGLSAMMLGAFLISGCNTLQDTASGVKQTAVGVEKTVKGAVVGAEKDVQTMEKKSTAKHKVMGDSHHEPAG